MHQIAPNCFQNFLGWGWGKPPPQTFQKGLGPSGLASRRVPASRFEKIDIHQWHHRRRTKSWGKHWLQLLYSGACTALQLELQHSVQSALALTCNNTLIAGLRWWICFVNLSTLHQSPYCEGISRYNFDSRTQNAINYQPIFFLNNYLL